MPHDFKPPLVIKRWRAFRKRPTWQGPSPVRAQVLHAGFGNQAALRLPLDSITSLGDPADDLSAVARQLIGEGGEPGAVRRATSYWMNATWDWTKR